MSGSGGFGSGGMNAPSEVAKASETMTQKRLLDVNAPAHRRLGCQRRALLVGLLGPAVGDLIWRLPGVVGYGVVFPLVCLMIGIVFKKAAASLGQDQYAGAREPRTAVLHH